jgi:chaperonin GroEL
MTFILFISYNLLTLCAISNITQVTINAIENAASIAALVLTTEVLITEIPKKEPAFVPNDPE